VSFTIYLFNFSGVYMPVVVDNVFSRDTYGVRAERLIAIQENFDSVQPDLQTPAQSSPLGTHSATWTTGQTKM